MRLLFNIRSICIETFNIVPMFNPEDLNIRENSDKKRSIRVKLQVRKKLLTINELFGSIERRYNKFKYAYYNKGVSNLDKDRIAFCHRTASLMLKKLKSYRKYLKDTNDPKLKSFDKRLQNAEHIVNTYGKYIDKLNKGQCSKIGNNKK